eukprot:snap_masked-scaffold_9-processed-gene-7.44-mRNA-1 protein AED:1.00 eAED:1.00 QI:0/-1/0/0/-1/1/1/0/131
MLLLKFIKVEFTRSKRYGLVIKNTNVLAAVYRLRDEKYKQAGKRGQSASLKETDCKFIPTDFFAPFLGDTLLLCLASWSMIGKERKPIHMLESWVEVKKLLKMFLIMIEDYQNSKAHLLLGNEPSKQGQYE